MQSLEGEQESWGAESAIAPRLAAARMALLAKKYIGRFAPQSLALNAETRTARERSERQHFHIGNIPHSMDVALTVVGVRDKAWIYGIIFKFFYLFVRRIEEYGRAGSRSFCAVADG